MNSDFKRMRHSSAKFNQDIYIIETYSGYRSQLKDPEGECIILNLDCTDAKMGSAIMLALSASRLVDPDDQDFFSLEKSNERYLGWVKDIMDKFGYKTKKALFKKMNSCSITQLDGMITFRPTIHEKLEGWSGDRIDEKDYVVISDTSSPEDIGAALRLAFTRCKSRV